MPFSLAFLSQHRWFSGKSAISRSCCVAVLLCSPSLSPLICLSNGHHNIYLPTASIAWLIFQFRLIWINSSTAGLVLPPGLRWPWRGHPSLDPTSLPRCPTLDVPKSPQDPHPQLHDRSTGRNGEEWLGGSEQKNPRNFPSCQQFSVMS